MAKRIQIEPFTKLPCGWVIGPDGSDAFGNGKTAYQCSGCFGRGSSPTRRMLPSYGPKQIKYCRDCRDAACLMHWQGEVKSLTLSARKSALSIWNTTRNAIRTGEMTGLPKAVIDVLVRDEFRRLTEMFSPWRLSLIATDAKDRSTTTQATCRRFKLTEAQLMMVCTLHSQNVKVAREAAQVESQKLVLVPKNLSDVEAYEAAKAEAEYEARAAWTGMPAADQSEIKELIYRFKSLMVAALESAANTPRGQYQSEFTTAQYINSERFSELKWIYDVAVRMPSDVAGELFGDLVARFVALVRYTQRSRDERRRRMIDRVRAIGSRPKRKLIVMAKRSGSWTPRQSTGEVIAMMSTRAQYLFVVPTAA